MSIRDTSAQDRPVASSTTPAARKRRGWLLVAGAGVTGLLLVGWLLSGWSAGSRSFDAARVRIAEVTRGDLVRDISADGRVIAANSPTLYAMAGGTVTLQVVAGDVVKKDQALAEIDSPELRSRLAQEEATLASFEAEAGRAALDAQLARSTARKLLDQAEIDRQAASRDLERNQRGFDGGAVAQIDVARAQDNLNKAEIGVAHAHEDYGLQGQGASLDTRNKRLLADRQRAVVAELQRQVDALTLRAPFDGQVGQVQVAQGANVAPNAPVLERGRPVEVRSRDQGAGKLRARPRHRHAGAARPAATASRIRARCRRSRRKWSTAKSPRACASATSSRPACARTSA